MQTPGLELRDARRAPARRRRPRPRRVMLRVDELVGPDGLVVDHAGARAVGALRVELHVVDVHVGLRAVGRRRVLGSNSVTSVSATQSPRLARMASGSAGLSPASTAALSLLRTKILPVGSVPWPLIVDRQLDRREVELAHRRVRAGRGRPRRPAHGLALSLGLGHAPRCRGTACRCARWGSAAGAGRCSGAAAGRRCGRPAGLKRIFGRSPTKLVAGQRRGWPRHASGQVGPARRSPRARPGRRASPGRSASIVQFQTEPSSSLRGTPLRRDELLDPVVEVVLGQRRAVGHRAADEAGASRPARRRGAAGQRLEVRAGGVL